MVKSPISWLGGKSLLRKDIINLIPEHKCYVEVFGGAAWVLFGKDKSKVEIYNDINGELVNFFRMVKHHQPELLRILDSVIISKEIFNRIKDISLDKLTEIERAVRFYYLDKISFGSKMNCFCSDKSRKPTINENALNNIKEAYERIKQVWIENNDFKKIIKKFDETDTLFYCDPPYLGLSGYKGIKFDQEEHLALRNCLKDIKGKFILSVNDCPELREMYKEFTIKDVKVNYSISKKSSGRVKNKELIILNY